MPVTTASSQFIKNSLIFTASFVCLCATGWIARADWVRGRGKQDSLEAALRMVPGDWKYYRDLAEFKPAQAVPTLKKAVELNPRNSSLRIELGEYAEQNGDLTTAEESFRNAVALDRTYGPRGELAGFYFRRQDRDRFAGVARSALESVQGSDPNTLFQEYWTLLGYGPAVPRRMLGRYLSFLLSSGHLDAVRETASRIMEGTPDSGEITQMEGFCDRMLSVGDGVSAAAAWKWLGKGISLENASGRGFDWRLDTGNGVYFEKSGAGVRVSFSGEQPENCDVLWRYVLLKDGVEYELRAPATGPGLRWELLRDGQTELGRLVLRYERAKGTVRFEGNVEIRAAELAPK